MYNFLNAILGGPIPFHLESVDALEKVRWWNKIWKGISPVRIIFWTRTKKSTFRCNPCTLSWSKKPPAQSLSTWLMQVMAAKAEASDPWYASWGWAMAEMGPQDSEIPTCPSSKSQSSQCSPKEIFLCQMAHEANQERCSVTMKLSQRKKSSIDTHKPWKTAVIQSGCYNCKHCAL